MQEDKVFYVEDPKSLVPVDREWVRRIDRVATKSENVVTKIAKKVRLTNDVIEMTNVMG
jgi:hypothetical protein